MCNEQVAVWSLTGMIGHRLGAADATQCLLALTCTMRSTIHSGIQGNAIHLCMLRGGGCKRRQTSREHTVGGQLHQWHTQVRVDVAMQTNW